MSQPVGTLNSTWYPNAKDKQHVRELFAKQKPRFYVYERAPFVDTSNDRTISYTPSSAYVYADGVSIYSTDGLAGKPAMGNYSMYHDYSRDDFKMKRMPVAGLKHEEWDTPQLPVEFLDGGFTPETYADEVINALPAGLPNEEVDEEFGH